MGRKIWFLLMIAILVTAGYLVGYTVQVITPTIDSIAQLKVKSMMSKNINDAVRDKFAEDIDPEDLFRITADADGKITMIQTDTAAMGRLTSDLTYRIQERISGMKNENVDIPMGSILGSPILSQLGPSLQIRIVPLSSAKVNYKSEFVDAGVNQTCHRIYLQVDSSARLLAPFSKGEVQLHSQLLIAETIVVGDVPQSYIVVPEDKVLDALE